MKSHEQLNSSPDLTVEGEVYNEKKTQEEFERMANELELGARKAEVARPKVENVGEKPALSTWEKMAASVPGFDRERAEQARDEKERDNAQKERFETVKRVLEEGSIEGRETELYHAINDLNRGVTYNQSLGYHRYMRAAELNRNPEEHWEKKPGNNWLDQENYSQESKEIRAVKRLSDKERQSIDRIVAFEQERQRREYEAAKAKREEEERAEEDWYERNSHSASHNTYGHSIAEIRGIENGRMRRYESKKRKPEQFAPHKNVEAPESTPKKHEEEPQSYEEPAELPDQGPDLTDPMFGMFNTGS